MHTSVVTFLKPHISNDTMVTSEILKPSQIQVKCLLGQKGPYFRYSSSLEDAKDAKFTCQGWINARATFTDLNPLLKCCDSLLKLNTNSK